MSAETDVALMMELEGKIDQRIKDTMLRVMSQITPTAHADNYGIQVATAQAVKTVLLSDNYFITELAKRIGQKMQNIYS